MRCHNPTGTQIALQPPPSQHCSQNYAVRTKQVVVHPCVCLIEAATQSSEPRSAMCTSCFLCRSSHRGSPQKLSTALQQTTQEQVCMRLSCNSLCALNLDVAEDPRPHTAAQTSRNSPPHASRRAWQTAHYLQEGIHSGPTQRRTEATYN